MQGQSTVLEMTSYKIVNFKYELNKTYVPEGKTLSIPFDFQTGFKKIDEKNLLAIIKTSIENGEKFPFQLNIEIESSFKADGWIEHKEQVELTIATILFPYVRALITSLTAAAGIQPIMLPVMNVAEMMKNQKK